MRDKVKLRYDYANGCFGEVGIGDGNTSTTRCRQSDDVNSNIQIEEGGLCRLGVVRPINCDTAIGEGCFI